MNVATPEVGQRAEPRTYGPITSETIVRYSAASGDLNPMHYDKDFAQQAGYPTVFSQGMNSAALLGSFLSDWFEPAWIRRFGVRFRELVWPGDLLECSGRSSRSPRSREVAPLPLSFGFVVSRARQLSKAPRTCSCRSPRRPQADLRRTRRHPDRAAPRPPASLAQAQRL